MTAKKKVAKKSVVRKKTTQKVNVVIDIKTPEAKVVDACEKDSPSLYVPPAINEASAHQLMRELHTKLFPLAPHGLHDKTAIRFLKYLHEFNHTNERRDDLIDTILHGSFENPNRHDSQMIVQTNIPLRAVCEHHLLPFFGSVAIGYIPGKRILGLSKFARLVEVIGTAMPSLQEKITNEIVEALDTYLEPKGVIVVASATHTCMSVRGVATPTAVTTSSAVRGIFRDVPAAREEFFSIIKGK